MKHLTLLFFCLMAWSHVNAQVSITYNNEAQWKTYDDFNAVFLDSGDSIVNGTTYHKMHGKPLSIVRKDGECQIFSIPATDMVALWPKLWREEGKKVYGYKRNKEQLYYDFSVGLGSVVVIADATTTVISVDTVTANGQLFRRIMLEPFWGV